jgi:hypothetical protein
MQEILSQRKIQDKGKKNGDKLGKHEMEAEKIGKCPHQCSIDR